MKQYILTNSIFPKDKERISEDLALKSEKGLIGINEQYEVILSADLLENRSKNYFVKYFAPIEKGKLQMPQKYLTK